eukprot:1070892-Prymnesium_polylepis.2
MRAHRALPQKRASTLETLVMTEATSGILPMSVSRRLSTCGPQHVHVIQANLASTIFQAAFITAHVSVTTWTTEVAPIRSARSRAWRLRRRPRSPRSAACTCLRRTFRQRRPPGC